MLDMHLCRSKILGFPYTIKCQIPHEVNKGNKNQSRIVYMTTGVEFNFIYVLFNNINNAYALITDTPTQMI